MESEVLEFHKRVREAYLQSSRREPERFVVIDARLSREEIGAQVGAAVDRLLEERGLPTGRTP
jgi:dTMP kinase